jgi:hypothetical protein
MTAELTTQEKIAIISTHQSNLAYNRYNLSISIVEENAKSSPDANALERLNDQLSDVDRQLSALATELASLPPVTN